MTRAAAALGLALALLAGGCMGTPTRGILLPATLRGAHVTCDGEPAWDLKQGIEAIVPIEAGLHVIRVEAPGARPLVQRTRIFLNDPDAKRAGGNTIVARIEQSATHRVIRELYPTDPLSNLQHDFDPPAGGEGVVLLSTEKDTRVAIDGKPAPGAAPLPSKPGIALDPYPSKGVVVRLAPGKHRVEFSKAGFRALALDVDVVAGEYEVLGAALVKGDT